MSKNKFVLNREGVRDLMQSDDMQAILNEKGNAAVTRLGSGYESKLHLGKTRANVNVFATTYKARRENYKHNTILKAVK